MQLEINRHYKHNFIVNMLDGTFFGWAMGFASFIIVIPLFVSNMTNSAILIGLIPAIHTVGWQLPQLFMARSVSRQVRFKNMVLKMTIHERLPFFALGLVALSFPVIGPKIALVLTFFILVWQGLGAGITASPWQSMVAKIFPSEYRGTFLGAQSGAYNLLSSGAAIAAGFLLNKLGFPYGFAVCFFTASLGFIVSYIFVSLTREPESILVEEEHSQVSYRRSLVAILRRDNNFAWFIVVRILSQFAMMAFGFYTVFAVRHHGMNAIVAGFMMSVFTFGQIIVNPLMGWMGDRGDHTLVMKIGVLCASLSALIAWLAPSLDWFYLVFILAGVANVAVWTIGVAITLEFGKENERPAYIGLSNTLVAPFAIIAPIIGGWLADTVGYNYTFLANVIFGLVTVLVLQFFVQDPRRVSLQIG
jgi:MFS family permease